MLFAFTASFAMPKDNLEITKKDNYEKIITADVGTIDIVIDVQFLQDSKVDRTDIQNNYNSQRFNIYRIQESGLFSLVKKSGFSKNINSYKQNYGETTNSKIQTFYSKVIQDRKSHQSRMHLRGIQRSDTATEGSNYSTKTDHYFKRKYGYLSSIENSSLGNAINLDWGNLFTPDYWFSNIYSNQNLKA